MVMVDYTAVICSENFLSLFNTCFSMVYENTEENSCGNLCALVLVVLKFNVLV